MWITSTSSSQDAKILSAFNGKVQNQGDYYSCALNNCYQAPTAVVQSVIHPSLGGFFQSIANLFKAIFSGASGSDGQDMGDSFGFVSLGANDGGSGLVYGGYSKSIPASGNWIYGGTAPPGSIVGSIDDMPIYEGGLVGNGGYDSGSTVCPGGVCGAAIDAVNMTLGGIPGGGGASGEGFHRVPFDKE